MASDKLFTLPSESIEDILEAHVRVDPGSGCRCGWRMPMLSLAIGVSPLVAHQAHVADAIRRAWFQMLDRTIDEHSARRRGDRTYDTARAAMLDLAVDIKRALQ